MVSGDAFTLALLVLIKIFLPLGLMLVLFALSRRYRGMFDQLGFTRKELGLLLVGSLTALLVPSELPVVLYKNYFLAVNLGGGIIPTVLSVHLLRSKRVSAAAYLPGILAVSLVTFLITRVQPSRGIVAEFPYMFLPALTAAIVALVLYSRNSVQAPAFAYACATLGSLIGADVFHLPELFQAPKFAGSIGGAGVFDLVYIGGIVSFAVVLVFAMRRLKRLQATLPHAEIAREKVLGELRDAASALMRGNYQLAAQRALGAVQERVRQLGAAFSIPGAPTEVLHRLLPDPMAARGYQQLGRYANLSQLDFYSARWTVLEAQDLLQRLQAVERTRYAPLGRRMLAFALDAVFMCLVLGAFAALMYAGGARFEHNNVFTFGLLFWAFMIQVVYFTLFEHFDNGRTPGKRITGLRVADLMDRPPDFISVFTRNTIRLLDLALLLYLGALLLIQHSERAQRLGDRIAETVVLQNKAVILARPTQPIYSPSYSTRP